MTYQYEPKTTYTYRGGYSVIHNWKHLGSCEINGQKFTALTLFSSFTTANSIRGRSTFILVDNQYDTLRYDVGMYEDLPIDRIGQSFVFLVNNQLEFGKIDTMNTEILCFSVTNLGCFLKK